MPAPLDENQLRDALSERHCWEGHRETGIHCHRELPSFAAVMRLVAAVGEAAEEMDHHPDIDIRYNKVTFCLLTHSAGGVTELDIALAEKIDSLVEAELAGASKA